MRDLTINLTHLITVFQILVDECKDLGLDQIVEIDKKKMTVADIRGIANDTFTVVMDHLHTEAINIPIDKDIIIIYEMLIRRSVIWQ